MFKHQDWHLSALVNSLKWEERASDLKPDVLFRRFGGLSTPFLSTRALSHAFEKIQALSSRICSMELALNQSAKQFTNRLLDFDEWFANCPGAAKH